jgi:NAD(P)-dependent dehydrogenase (short-subunit alcohol dehydrogenase family)
MGAVASLKAGPVVGAAYIASMRAIVGLTKTGAIEYAGQGIRANVVCTTMMRTPLSDKMMSTEGGRARVLLMHPIGRIGEPEKVSNLVLWLCSQEAGFITGAVIPIDGEFLLK